MSIEQLANSSVEVGDHNAVYVPRPGGNPLAFAAIVASVASTKGDKPYEAAAKLPEIAAAAHAASISEADGYTSALGKETTLSAVGKVIHIARFQAPPPLDKEGSNEGAKDADGVIKLIDEQHRSDKSVAMFYREQDDAISPKPAYRWVLLPRHSSSKHKTTYELFDPQRQRAAYVLPSETEDKIAKSLKAGGVWAYTMTAEKA